jgi:hypothetical protein
MVSFKTLCWRNKDSGMYDAMVVLKDDSRMKRAQMHRG